jgi:hypothetical protein
MMTDYISKQDAVSAVEFGITYASAINIETGEWTELFKNENDELREAIKRIRDLPPAETMPVRHARWIKPTGMMPPEHHGHYECSECGTWAGRDWLRPWKEVLLTDFCPGCAAKMDGEE